MEGVVSYLRGDRQRGGGLGLLPAFDDGVVGVEAHAEDGDEDAHHVAGAEGVLEDDVAEGEHQARLEVAQNLVRHGRCRADHQERAEVDAHRDRARQQDERLHTARHGALFEHGYTDNAAIGRSGEPTSIVPRVLTTTWVV